MNNTSKSIRSNGMRLSVCVLAMATLGAWGNHALAQKPSVTKGNTTAAGTAARATTTTDLATVGPALDLVIGKSTLMRLPSPIERISVGNPNVADISLISPVELYLLGKSYGSTNLMIWRKGGATTAIDVNVSIDADRMEKKLRELLPDEKGIKVRPAADSVILTGTVSSATKAKAAEDIANAFVRDINRNLVLPVTAGNAKVQSGATLAVQGAAATGGGSGANVVNLLQVTQGQQVMLEVKVAEVSKTLLDKLGVNLNASATTAGVTYNILTNLLVNGSGAFSISGNGNLLKIDAEKKDGLIKILAEPNIISISGQEASFLAGGKIFIPVARVNATTGGSTVTLEEKEFGVGLKFTPTVLEGGRIHLKVAPEVSELSQTGSPFTTVDGTTAILPSFTTRRVQTTVQLMDGQSLAIAGLIKNNVSETFKRVPILGEVPILGALFRSSEFQNDRSELMFLITPRLVKPLDGPVALPTDSFTPPSRGEFFMNGKLEGSGNQDVPPDRVSTPTTPPASSSGGFEVK